MNDDKISNNMLTIDMLQNAMNILNTQPLYRSPRYLISPNEMKLCKQEMQRTGEDLDTTAHRLQHEGRIIPIPM